MQVPAMLTITNSFLLNALPQYRIDACGHNPEFSFKTNNAKVLDMESVDVAFDGTDSVYIRCTINV
jgi:hypothetical protein